MEKSMNETYPIDPSNLLSWFVNEQELDLIDEVIDIKRMGTPFLFLQLNTFV